MKVSVITINYNNSEGLERTIESVVNQSFSDFEYLVIDGNSTDGSIDVIKKYSGKIDYWISEPDSGVYNAMNKGIKQAKGEYLLFINSGDYLYTDNVLLDVFKSDLDYDIIYGDLHRSFPNGSQDIVYNPPHISVKHMIEATIPHPSSFIRRNLFFKYGLYREDLKIVSDWAFFLKLISFTPATQKHVPIIISSFSMDGLSCKNITIVERERYEVVQESFSPELNYVSRNFDTYEQFYNKVLFKKIRSLEEFVNKCFSKNKWLNYFYEKRLNKLISLFDNQISFQKKNPLSIPIIIINYNRLDDLKQMISFFLDKGHQNIVVVDNASTYPPLLKYYEEIKSKVTIEMMDKNEGHMVFWRNDYLKSKYGKGYYVITDSDIIPNSHLPDDYLLQMIKLLEQNINISKVGFALDIESIPDYFKYKKEVVAWEKQYWSTIIEENVYLAETDTTFALYHPYFTYKDRPDFLKGIRVGGRFTAIHKGWYIDNENLSEELKYYYETSNASNSWKFNDSGEFIGDALYLKKK